MQSEEINSVDDSRDIPNAIVFGNDKRDPSKNLFKVNQVNYEQEDDGLNVGSRESTSRPKDPTSNQTKECAHCQPKMRPHIKGNQIEKQDTQAKEWIPKPPSLSYEALFDRRKQHESETITKRLEKDIEWTNSNEENLIPHFENVHNLDDGQMLLKALASESITHTIKTPCDSSRWIQAFQNPSDQNCIIVVQKVTHNTEIWDQQQNFTPTDQMFESCDCGSSFVKRLDQHLVQLKEQKCSDCQKLKNNPESESKLCENKACLKKCRICLKQQPVSKSFFCEKKECLKTFCNNCLLQNFVQQNLSNKTNKHSFYDEFELRDNGVDSGKGSLKMRQIHKNQKSRSCLRGEQSVIISFWYKNDQFENQRAPRLDCRYQFQIFDPIFLHNNDLEDNLSLSEFLFKGHQSNKLFFLTYVNDDIYVSELVTDDEETLKKNIKQNPNFSPCSKQSFKCGKRLKQELMKCLSNSFEKLGHEGEYKHQNYWPLINDEIIAIQYENDTDLNEKIQTFKTIFFMKGNEEPFYQQDSVLLLLKLLFDRWKNQLTILTIQNSNEVKGEMCVNFAFFELIKNLNQVKSLDNQNKNYPLPKIQLNEKTHDKNKYRLKNQAKKSSGVFKTKEQKEDNSDILTLNIQRMKLTGIPKVYFCQNNEGFKLNLLFEKVKSLPNFLKYELAPKTSPKIVAQIKMFGVCYSELANEDSETFLCINNLRVDESQSKHDPFFTLQAQVDTLNFKQGNCCSGDTFDTRLNFPKEIGSSKQESIQPNNTKFIPFLFRQDDFKTQEYILVAILSENKVGQVIMSFTKLMTKSKFNCHMPQTLTNEMSYQDYPLLGYLGPEPCKNKVYFVNTARNVQQSAVDLGQNYQFVRFLEKGTQQPCYFENLGCQRLLFLVKCKQTMDLKIFSYAIDSWNEDSQASLKLVDPYFGASEHAKDYVSSEYLASIHHLNQFILFRKDFTQRQATFLKCIIQNYGNSQDKGSEEVAQQIEKEKMWMISKLSELRVDFCFSFVKSTETNIYVHDCLKNESYEIKSKIQGKSIQLLPIPVVCGHSQDALYVCYDRVNQKYQVRRHFRNKSTNELLDECIYEQSDQILAFSEIKKRQKISNDPESSLTMAILDSNCQYKLLQKSNDQWIVKTRQIEYSNYMISLMKHLESGYNELVILGQKWIQAPSHFFESTKKQCLQQLNLESMNLIELISMNQSTLNVATFSDVPDIAKNLILVRQKCGKSCYLLQNKPNIRHYDLMNAQAIQQFIQQIVLTEERYFVMVDHSNTLNYLNEDYFCIEIDRKTLLVVDVHQNVSEVRVCHFQPGQNQYVVLFDKDKQNVRTLEITRFCQNCQNRSIEKKEPYQLPQEFETLNNQRYLLDQKGEFYLFDFDLDEEEDQKNAIIRIWQEPLVEGVKIKSGIKVHILCEQLDCEFDQDDDQADYQIILTNDFVVIRAGTRIFYFIVSDLSDPQYDKKFGKEVRTCSNVSEIPLHKMTIFEEAQKLLDISPIQFADYKYYDQRKRSYNIIQIGLETKLIIWDLEKNEMIEHLKDQSKFVCPQHFIDTGFNLYQVFASDRSRKLDMKLIQQTQDQICYCISYNQPSSEIGCCFRTFSVTNIREILMLLQLDGSHNHHVAEISTLLCNIYGLSFFEALNCSNFVEYSVQKFQDLFEEQPEIYSKEQFEIQSQILNQIVTKPTSSNFKISVLADDKDAQKYAKDVSLRPDFRRNIVQRYLRFLIIATENDDIATSKLQKLFSVISQLSDVYMYKYVCCVDEFWMLFCKYRDLPGFKEFIEKWNKTCQEFPGSKIEVNWNSQFKIITFGSEIFFLRDEEIVSKILEMQRPLISRILDYCKRKKYSPAVIRQVKKLGDLSFFKVKQSVITVNVRKYGIDWLRDNEKKLYTLLSVEDETSLYSELFVRDMLSLHDLSKQLFFVAMLPYCIEIFHLCFYYMNNLGDSPDNWDSTQTYVWTVALICMAWLIFLELVQLRQLNWNIISYLNDYWNLLFLCMNIMTLTILKNDINGEFSIGLTIKASVSGYLMITGLFYWSQIFSAISMYFRIILSSVVDSFYFIGLFFLFLFSFACAIYILDQTSEKMFQFQISPIYDGSLEAYPEITIDRTTNELLDNFFLIYKLMLGDFEIIGNERFDTANQTTRNVLFLYFGVTTFMANIVFLNIMVAVLSESYGEMWAFKEDYALQQQTAIFSDYIMFLKTKIPSNNFIFIIQPSKGEEVDAVQSSIDELKSSIEDLQTQQRAQNEQIAEKIHRDKVQLQSQIELVEKNSVATQLLVEKIHSTQQSHNDEVMKKLQDLLVKKD